MVKKGSNECAMIACCKGGAHTGEYAKYLCLQEGCRSVDLVLCQVCRMKSHSSHQVIEITDFFQQLKRRVNAKRIRDYSSISAIVEEAQSVCRNSLLNFQAHFIGKIEALQSVLQNTFSVWKTESSIFEEHHALAVIDDISSMQQESDSVLFANQLRRILPHITFDDDTITVKKRPLNSHSHHQRPSTIKAISKNLLGLPPLSVSEVHEFQQSLLHSLKKISDTLNDSLHSIRYANTKTRSNSALNMTEYSQYRDNGAESEIDNNNMSGILDSISMMQSSNKRIPSVEQTPQRNSIQQHPANLFSAATVNLQQSYQQNSPFSSSLRGSNTTTPRRQSFISAKGTYKASDLISHYSKGGGADEEVFNDDTFSGKVERSKRNSVLSSTSNTQIGGILSSNSKGKFYVTPTESAVSQNTGYEVIDQVQRQVTGIQKSIDNLKGSLDFQKITSYLEERNSNNSTPIKNAAAAFNSNGVARVMIPGGNGNFFSNCSSLANTPRSQVVTGAGAAIEQIKTVEQYKKNVQAGNGGGLMNLHGSSPFGKRASTAVSSAMPSMLHGSASKRKSVEMLSFAEKFQKFSELSMRRGSNATETSQYPQPQVAQEQSRPGSANGSSEMYERYFFDSMAVRGQKEEEEEARKKNDAVVSQKKVHFRFSNDLHHEFVKVSKFIACGQKDSFETRLVLLEPSVEILPHRETTFSFLIKNCKNEEFAHPLALGLCHKNIVSANNFQFAATNLNEFSYSSRSTLQQQQQQPHGCYLLTASGYLRNHAYAKQDMKKVPVRFGVNDVIVCCFNPFRKTLQFTKKSTGETCILNVETIPTDKLYPCIRISYAQDTVEYVQQ